jgi:hypothetical protein
VAVDEHRVPETGDTVTTDYLYDWEEAGLPEGIYYYEETIDGHATCKSWLTD